MDKSEVTIRMSDALFEQGSPDDGKRRYDASVITSLDTGVEVAERMAISEASTWIDTPDNFTTEATRTPVAFIDTIEGWQTYSEEEWSRSGYLRGEWRPAAALWDLTFLWEEDPIPGPTPSPQEFFERVLDLLGKEANNE